MPRSLANGKTKFTLLTTEPADPSAPTAAELNAGIQSDAFILDSDFMWGATDSDKVGEKALSEKNNTNALSAGNHQAGITPFRMFDEDGQPDPAADTVFGACKVKGTELWGYSRRTGQDASDAWTTGDEIFCGMHVVTDTPQPPSDMGGYVKFRVPMEPQEAWDFIEVAAGG